VRNGKCLIGNGANKSFAEHYFFPESKELWSNVKIKLFIVTTNKGKLMAMELITFIDCGYLCLSENEKCTP
jgi:hypothetical protein